MTNLVGCNRCGHASPAQSRFCERCSAPLAYVPQGKSQQVGLSGNQKLLVAGIIIIGGLVALAVAVDTLLGNKNKSNVNSNQPAVSQPSAATTPATANQQPPTEQAAKPAVQPTAPQPSPEEPKETTFKVGGETLTVTADGIIKVPAKVLWLAYEANEVTADEVFKGKTLEVTGKVDRIAKDILDKMYVTLKVKDYSITSVQCLFPDSEKEALTQLSPNKMVTIKGKCNGKFGNVLLKDCVVQFTK
jgi:heat shock protein HslJ